MIERTDLQFVTKRINEPKRFIQVLVGPRQTGKTTLLLQLLDKVQIASRYETADAVSASDVFWLSQVWESVRMQMKAAGLQEFLLVIDEVQKLGNWSETVKKEWDADIRNNLNIKVILSGSSRLLLQKGLTESLAGRFELFHFTHWSFSEMQAAFGWDIEKYVYFGGYPGAAPLVEDEKRWQDYVRNSLVETSISKDILMLTRVDKPALLKQLFELGAYFSGQILSFNKILGQLLDAGNTTTLSNYLHLLDESGLLGGIEKYAGNIVNIRSSSPKFQVYNNALLSVQRGENFLTARTSPDLWGRLVESAVGAHLLNHKAEGNYHLYYWREGNFGVDFVLEKHGKRIGLEVKSGQATTNRGISAFNKKFPDAKAMIVGTGGIPYEEFLKINPKSIV
ncbi:MAG: ATP-binding protein [Candidatus Symbiothrix sp.]|jgi:predicted AAA+ superfamily ATPase|nr:ATP-binding protein [Candidatus Symbiothrix sp.]